MQPNKSKATLQLVIATLLSLFGIALLGAAFVTAPPGEIHSSVLIAYGEVMTFAGALFGIDYHYPRPLPTPLHTPPDRHTRPLHTHLTTPYLLPFILYLYICTSPRPPAARSHPALSSPLHPSVQLPTLFRTHSPRPQHLTAIFLYFFPPLFHAPSAPPSAEKFALPRLKQAVTHLWKSFIPKEKEDLSSTSYPDDIVWITL